MDYANENEPRILFLDIETKPAIVASFGIRDQHIGHKQILKDGGVICVGLKWADEKRVRVLSEWEHGWQGMIEETHKALSEADAVATYNGASFDIPKLMGCFLLAGLPPPPPPHTNRHLQVRPQARLHLQQARLHRASPWAGHEGEARRAGDVAVRDGRRSQGPEEDGDLLRRRRTAHPGGLRAGQGVCVRPSAHGDDACPGLRNVRIASGSVERHQANQGELHPAVAMSALRRVAVRQAGEGVIVDLGNGKQLTALSDLGRIRTTIWANKGCLGVELTPEQAMEYGWALFSMGRRAKRG